MTFLKINTQTERACEVQSESLLSKYMASCCVYCIIMMQKACSIELIIEPKEKKRKLPLQLCHSGQGKNVACQELFSKDPSIRMTKLTSLGLSR